MKNFTQIPNEILRDKKLTNTEFRILLYIYSHKNGYTLSNVQIADETGISRKTIISTKKNLINKGYLKVERKDRGYIHTCEIITHEMCNNVTGEEEETTQGEEGGVKLRNIRCEATTHEMCNNVTSDVKLRNTKNTNYNTRKNTNYNTSKNFEEIRERVKDKVNNFFNNLFDDKCREVIERIDKTFYYFQEYLPTNKEIEIFLRKQNPEILDKFDYFLYNGITSENFIYNGKLIKPRLSLLISNSFRMNELLNIYIDSNKSEETILSKPKENPIQEKKKELFGKAPSFNEFMKEESTEESKSSSFNLPPEESMFLQALHTYDSSYFENDDEKEATEEEIQNLINSF